MKHEIYELFEKFPDGSSRWRDSVPGFEITHLRLEELAQRSENQYYAINLTTGEVLASNSERMLLGSAHFQKLKAEARAKLRRYGRRVLGDAQYFVWSPK
jgi:hypothetical protein